MKRVLYLAAMTFLLLLASCKASTAEPQSATFFAMDTVMDVTVYSGSEDLLPAAEQMVRELEARLSVTQEDSEIAALNRNGSAQLSPETEQLLCRGLDLCKLTSGALDISIYPVVRAWGFTGGDYQVPTEETLSALLEKVDYSEIQMENHQASLPDGMQIDLGSIAKGYTGDLLLRFFAENGVTSALLNLGGNVQALGTRPDGSPWCIGIQNPEGAGYLGSLSVADSAVITSGGYERYFTGEDGTIYWHIIDPSTGCPAKNGLISVTIVGKEGVACDALSTALFIMGEEKSIAFWREQQSFDMLLVTEDGRLLVTSGLEESFQPDPQLAYEIEVIS